MDVIDCNLIGRKLLGFKEAIYYFEATGNNSCKLTGITTYTSVLTPGFIWSRWKNWVSNKSTIII